MLKTHLSSDVTKTEIWILAQVKAGIVKNGKSQAELKLKLNIGVQQKARAGWRKAEVGPKKSRERDGRLPKWTLFRDLCNKKPGLGAELQQKARSVGLFAEGSISRVTLPLPEDADEAEKGPIATKSPVLGPFGAGKPAADAIFRAIGGHAE